MALRCVSTTRSSPPVSSPFKEGCPTTVEEPHLDSAETKAKAALRYLRCKNYFTTNITTISSMSHREYRNFCRDIARPLFNRVTHIDYLEMVSHMVEKIAAYRKRYQNRCHYPLCTSLVGENGGAEFQLVPKSAFPEGVQSFKSLDQEEPCLFLTKEVAGDLKKFKKLSSISSEQIHAIVSYLSTLRDLLALHNMGGGCFARAHLIIELLVLMGVPDGMIGKQFLYVPEKWAKGKMKDWDYHLVPVIKNGPKLWVIDLVSSPKRAMKIDEWVENYVTFPSVEKENQVVKELLIVPSNETEPLEFEYAKVFTFTSVASLDIEKTIDKETQAPSFFISKKYGTAQETLAILADRRNTEKRHALEYNWLLDASFNLK